MLRKRSRPTAGGSKQGLVMSESSSLSPNPLPSSPTAKFSRPIVASLFPSPRLFTGIPGKVDPGDAAAMSPTSILENKSFSAATNPFFADRKSGARMAATVVVSTSEPPAIKVAAAAATTESKHHHHRPWQNGDSGRVGLGIVDALKDEDEGCEDGNKPRFNKPENSRMVLFGSQLKIQIPPILPTPISSPAAVAVESPRSPIEFGIKTKSMVLGSVSPIGRSPSPLGSSVHSSAAPATATAAAEAAVASPRVFAPGSLSTAEMELSEDYTCVIVHGPNPRTTHIFDNCIVEMEGDCIGADDGFPAAAAAAAPAPPRKSSSGRVIRYPSDSFLSFCYACKKALGDGEDIYMYRGDKAFCSHECRYQEMLFEEGTDDKCPPPL